MPLTWSHAIDDIDWNELAALSRGQRKIILYAVPGKEPFYRRFGFRRMLTAMAIFQDAASAQQQGYVDDT